ncbi:MAG TPA: DsbA family oxidoreductase [Burkholderiaceae bacterium]|nr:DsbA family oxidoreductase [Burkholderiaceae bacterium]
MKLQFVSDVACPWCAIGLNSLEIALKRIGDDAAVDLEVEPFELNPDMPPEGEDVLEYVGRKYGSSAAELSARHALIRERGAAVGFTFGQRTRIWNTFDAHRLLHWAGLEGRKRELKHALLAAYHTRGENPGSREVLLRVATEVGLDVERARAVFESGEYGAEVRERIRHWQQLGIHSVPSIVVDGRYLIQGGQPPEAFEQALREIAAEARAA